MINHTIFNVEKNSALKIRIIDLFFEEIYIGFSMRPYSTNISDYQKDFSKLPSRSADLSLFQENKDRINGGDIITFLKYMIPDLTCRTDPQVQIPGPA